MSAKRVVGEVERWVGVGWSTEHGGRAHELGGGHVVEVRVVAAHRVGQRVRAHPSHPRHPRSEPVRSTVNPWREEASDPGTFLL